MRPEAGPSRPEPPRGRPRPGRRGPEDGLEEPWNTLLPVEIMALPFFVLGSLRLSVQNRAREPVPGSVIQKLIPSLAAPKGLVPAPTGKNPIGERSAAFQSHAPWLKFSETRTRSPSKAAAQGPPSEGPVSVASTAPLEARTTLTEGPSLFGTQMLAPSKAG